MIAAQLRTAQADGDIPRGLDPDLEATSLMTMFAGLGTSVLAGHSWPGQAQAVIDYPLRRPCSPHSASVTPGRRLNWSAPQGQAYFPGGLRVPGRHRGLQMPVFAVSRA